MAWTIIVAALSISLTGLGWYCFFYQREKKLLNHLERMLELAREGKSKQYEVSEREIAVVENSFQRFLDESAMITRRQEEQKERIQGLISDISHQTLTPISNLKLYTELLGEADCGQPELLQIIKEQTEKLDFLIQSLVKLSRMENGIIMVHPACTEISKLLKGIYSEYKVKAERKQIDFFVEPTDLKAEFDLKWTHEAIGNIIDNAIKYTKAGGHIRVMVQEYTLFSRIDVSDDGIGIAQEEIPNIFSRFYRSLCVEDQMGVGIGLYLTKEIVQAQGGYMKVVSRKGRGSTFSVFLPCRSGGVSEA